MENTEDEHLKSIKKPYYTPLNEEEATTSFGGIEENETTKGALSVISGQETEYQKMKSSKYRKSSLIEEFLTQTKASMFSSSVNLCNMNIGAGVLGLPFAVSKSGVVVGLILFVVFAVITQFAFNLLMEVGRLFKTSSYAIVCNQIKQPKLQLISDLCISIHYFLVCGAYLIIIGDYLPKVVHAISDRTYSNEFLESFIEERWFWMLTYMVVFIAPTFVLKKLDALRFSSTIAMCCFIYVTIIVVMYAFFIDLDGAPQNPKVDLVSDNALSFFKSAPLYIFAFGGHALAFSLSTELERNTMNRVNIVLTSSFFVITVIYASVAIGGYVTFGNDIDTNIINNYPTKNTVIVTLRICMSIAIAFSYPVVGNSFKNSLASLLFGLGRHKDKLNMDATDLSDKKYYALVIIIMASTFALALAVDTLGDVLSIDGATVGTMIQIVNPALIYYFASKNLNNIEFKSNPWHQHKKNGAIALIIFGLIVMPFSVVFIFVDY